MDAIANRDPSAIIPPETEQLNEMARACSHAMKILGVQPTGIIIATFEGVVFGRDRLDRIIRLKMAGYKWETWPLKTGKTVKGWSKD